MGARRVVAAVRHDEGLEGTSSPTLELLERQLTAALYAVWKAQGVRKKIVTIDNGRSQNGRYDEGDS